MPETLHIHTDGSCLGNPGPGGFAAIMLIADDRITVTGGDPRATNNKMEVSAVLEALRVVAGEPELEEVPIVVHSDSTYVTNAFNKGWLRSWKRNGWRNSKGHLPNAQLWQELDRLTQGRKINWVWVKGHSGDRMNEACDRLAVEQAELARTEPRPWVSVGNPKSRAHRAANMEEAWESDTGPYAGPEPQGPVSFETGEDHRSDAERKADAALMALESLAAAIEDSGSFGEFKFKARRIFAGLSS